MVVMNYAEYLRRKKSLDVEYARLDDKCARFKEDLHVRLDEIKTRAEAEDAELTYVYELPNVEWTPQKWWPDQLVGDDEDRVAQDEEHEREWDRFLRTKLG